MCRHLMVLLKWDTVLTMDYPFRLSTKYTAAFMMIMTFLSFLSSRQAEIDCRGTDIVKYNEDGTTLTQQQLDVNADCLHTGVFLVRKAMDANMRAEVIHPGVCQYVKGVDQLEHFPYGLVWMRMVLLGLAGISILPWAFWKIKGTQKIKKLVDAAWDGGNFSVERQVSVFLEGYGFNDTYAFRYVFYKLLALTTPVIHFGILYLFLSPRYVSYGLDEIKYAVGGFKEWPTPMDWIFPKYAKCELEMYPETPVANAEIKSLLCRLPLNSKTQWVFLLLWFCSLLVFLVNFLSLICILPSLLPQFRRYHYRSFVSNVCATEVDSLRYVTTDTEVIRERDISEIIHVDLSFGDYMVLSFLEMNVPYWQFNDFLRTLSVTRNRCIQLLTVGVEMQEMNPNSDSTHIFQSQVVISPPVAVDRASLLP